MSQNLTDILSSSLPPGPSGPQGPAGTGTMFLYQFDASNQSQSNPGDGYVRFNNADASLTTQTFISVIDTDGSNRSF